MDQLKKTPIFPLYETYGAKVIDFGGWALPVQFQGIIEEHNRVREQAGLFDVSHMGEIVVTGEDALSFLQYLCTNDIAKLQMGRAIYTLLCYENGGTVDDVIIYRTDTNAYMLVVNASNVDKVEQWMNLQRNYKQNWDVTIDNVSAQIAQLAIQGPKAQEILQVVTDYDLSQIKRFHFVKDAPILHTKALISRTGYTGEDGFEIYIDSKDGALIWTELLIKGASLGLAPIGLGARDTLRLEAGLPLYGQELSQEITPMEAQLEYFVSFDKGDFIGREALLEQKEQGLKRRLVGFQMIDRGIPRTHYPVFAEEKQVGEVTSGTFSPTLKLNIGMALVSKNYSAIGQSIEIEIRGKKIKAEVIPKPFFKRK